AFERQLQSDPPAVVSLLSEPDFHQARLFGFVLERAARVLASGASGDEFALLSRLFDAEPSDVMARPIIKGLDLGLEGRRIEAPPPALTQLIEKLWKSSAGAPSVALTRVCARLGRPSMIAAAVELACDRHKPESDRVAMIDLLGQLGRSEDMHV